MNDRWSAPEQTNLDTADRRTLVEQVGVIHGQVVSCWVVAGNGEPTPIETPAEDDARHRPVTQ
jgi:hypothetical protein